MRTFEENKKIHKNYIQKTVYVHKYMYIYICERCVFMSQKNLMGGVRVGGE